MLFADIRYENLGEAEKDARELLEHIEAIKEIQRRYHPVNPIITLKEKKKEANSAN